MQADFISLSLDVLNKLIMQSLQKQVQGLCQLATVVIGNPTQSPSDAAKKLGLSPESITNAALSLFFIESSFFGPLIGTSLYIWRKYTESQKRQQEKERMLREIIAKQQAVIRQLETEEMRQKQENAQNRVEVENLKNMLHILEQATNQIKTVA
ncbi:hypothetical protein [Porphyromonas sp.]